MMLCDICHFPLNLVFEDEGIQKVEFFDYLGVTIDKCLSFDKHIKKISSSISKTIGSLKFIKKFISKPILRQIYMTLIQPKIYYGILVWGHKSSNLQKLQKRAIRVVSGVKYNAHTDPLFKELNILKCQDIYKLQICKTYYKIENKICPYYLLNLPIKCANEIHNHETRTSYKFHKKYTRAHKVGTEEISQG